MDILYQQLQSRNKDNVVWQSDIGIFQNELQKEREKINEIETQINEEFPEAVSYTHLDVYKRQRCTCIL